MDHLCATSTFLDACTLGEKSPVYSRSICLEYIMLLSLIQTWKSVMKAAVIKKYIILQAGKQALDEHYYNP